MLAIFGSGMIEADDYEIILPTMSAIFITAAGELKPPASQALLCLTRRVDGHCLIVISIIYRAK